MDKVFELFHDDCLNILRTINDNSIDLVVTSPPYDNLRSYNNSLGWDFEKIAKELFRVLAKGGVIVWVVGDQTLKGSESGSSFKQALYFKSIGLNIHDTMIWQSDKPPLTHNRYEQKFEYMFVFSKGKPNTFNPIRESCTYAGTSRKAKTFRHNGQDLQPAHNNNAVVVSQTKIKGNIWTYSTGWGKSTSYKEAFKHPAIFPERLAMDHVISWSNPGDYVLDPFLGSGTTGVVCKIAGRQFIGIEKEKSYYEIAKKRIEATTISDSKITKTSDKLGDSINESDLILNETNQEPRGE